MEENNIYGIIVKLFLTLVLIAIFISITLFIYFSYAILGSAFYDISANKVKLGGIVSLFIVIFLVLISIKLHNLIWKRKVWTIEKTKDFEPQDDTR